VNPSTDVTSRPVCRLYGYPVAGPFSAPGYGPVFNAGLIHHDGAFHMFARAVRHGYRPNPEFQLKPGLVDRFLDYVSDIVVFTSTDGVDYHFAYVLVPAGTNGAVCFEDPRAQWVSDELVLTYTWLPPAERRPWRIGAHRLRWDGERFWLQQDSARLLGPSGVENKDGVVFELADGRVALVHRVWPCMHLAVFDSLDALWDADDSYWGPYMAELEHHVLLAPDPGAFCVGAGAPPVPTEAGLLFFFHERRSDGSYASFAALLDPATGEAVSRLPEPILEPELDWERNGDVGNVVFVQGAHRTGDTLYLIYGAADRYVGAATASVAHLLDALAAVGA
jgi:beta-1,2-mannobiose phosphorylase / 1,2-beta-oligomannan phosphorylase